MQKVKERISMVREEIDDDFLNNTSSPSIADSKCFSDSSGKTELDPYELLDGGLQNRANKLKTKAHSSSDEPKTKKKRIEAENEDVSPEIVVIDSIKKVLKVKENPELSDQTISIDETSKVYYSEESTFLNDFCHEVRNEKERSCDDISIAEIYATMRTKSRKLQIPCIFIAKGAIGSVASKVSIFDAETLDNNCRCDKRIQDRRRVILKLFSQRYGLKLTSETLHLGIALLDKCLNSLIVLPETLSDLACATIVIASKVEEVNFLTLRDALVCGLIRDKPIKMLCKLEQMVLKTLEFEVSFPTPLSFANYLLVTLGASPSKINMTHYLLELALLCVSTREYPSDYIAHAATCLAYGIDFHGSSTSVKSLSEAEFNLKSFSQIMPGTTRSLMKILVAEFQAAPSEEHEIYFEFVRSGRDSVALRKIDDELANMISFSK